MSTYQFPDVAHAANLIQLVSNAQVYRSALTGAIQTATRSGERLRATLTFNNLSDQERREVLALVAKLNGQQNRVALRDHSYTSPAGGITGVTEELPALVAANLTNSGAWLTVSDQTRGVEIARDGNDANGDFIYFDNETLTEGYSYAYRTAILTNSLYEGRGHATYVTSNASSTIIESTTVANFSDDIVTVEGFTAPLAAHEVGITDQLQAGVTKTRFVWEAASLSRCLLVDNGINELTRSEELDHADWTKSNATVSADAVAAPDGETTADELVENTASSTHYALQAVTRVNEAAFWTGTVYIKENTNRRIRLWVDNGAGDGGDAFFDANTGTIVSGPSDQGSGEYAFATIDDAGNGWYRCRVTVLLPSGNTTARIIFYMVDGATTTTNYTGDGTSGIYIWGAQLQKGGQIGRYVQTVGTAASGTSQTGREIYVKGMDRSSAKQLVAGDQVEINGQLCILQDDVNSDYSGTGIIKVMPRVRSATSDEDAVVLYKPHGTFLLASPAAGWSNDLGGFSSLTLDFIEDITI